MGFPRKLIVHGPDVSKSVVSGEPLLCRWSQASLSVDAASLHSLWHIADAGCTSERYVSAVLVCHLLFCKYEANRPYEK